ncbi:methyltransferase domain-containing protein [Chloroflexota bacterium]
MNVLAYLQYNIVTTKLARFLPNSTRIIANRIIAKYIKKHDAELAWWKSRYNIDHGTFRNAHYEKLMLAMAGEVDDSFLKGKFVSDFGCGPRGSLVWAKSALVRIGIDVLADRYANEFTEDIISHGMVYLTSTEKVIPLPSNSIDIMFTLNAIDHVDSLANMCREILRVLKPGGELIGSFNIGEPPTTNEPQCLDEETVKKHLLSSLNISSYRITALGPKENPYLPFFQGKLSYEKGQSGLLWVRASKPKDYSA